MSALWGASLAASWSISMRWERLRTWRSETAKHDGVPAYVIFHDSTLMQMLRERPQTADEVAAISGVGAAKLARYGDAFLAVLRRSVPVESGGEHSIAQV